MRARLDALGVEHTLSESRGVLTVGKVVVPEGQRERGVGTAAMQAITDYADAAGLHVALSPSADFGGNKARLTQFYKRFGFKENKGRAKVYEVSETMVRENPQGRTLFSRSASAAQALPEVAQQLKDTERAYGGRAAYDRAKAAGKTKLAYGQWVQVRTPNFKAWFGDWESDPAGASKVVDPDTGEPMVVYHGGTVGNVFSTDYAGSGGGRESAFFFTPDIRQAKDYAGTGSVKEVFISLRDPVETDVQLEPDEVVQAKADGKDGYWVIEDGLVEESEIAVFSSTQVKSATNNNGNFDGGNPDIRYSRSAATRATYEARIDALFAGDRAKAGTRILDASEVMGLLGYPRVPLMLNESHLRDGMGNHPEMTAAAWKKVPDWIENPAAVYADPRDSGRLIVLAPETLAGYPVMMVIEPKPTPAARGSAEPFQLLVTAYAKTTGGLPAAGFLASSGHLKYAHTQNAPGIWQSAGVQFPRQSALSQGRSRILSEKHLAGYRRANDPAFSGASGMTPEQAAAIVSAARPQSREASAAARRLSDERLVATQMLVDGLTERWSRAPEIIVARDMQDELIPQHVRDYEAKLKSQGASGEPQGFILGGKVYLLSDTLKTPNDIATVLFHEVLGHWGLRRAFGDALDPILRQVAVMRGKDVRAKAREYGLDFSKEGDRLIAAEEVLAEMAQTNPQLGFVQRAVAAIRNWLRTNVPGFKALAMTNNDIIEAFILPARGAVTRSRETTSQALARSLAAVRGEPAFGRSAMKSVEANIARGEAAMNRALLEKADQHRAMFRNGLGWVDFVWGDSKRGIAHIIERRAQSDGMERAAAERMLAQRVVETIARGAEVRRAEVGKATRLVLELDGNEAVLVRQQGSNGWLLTSFEKVPGAAAGGATRSSATQPTAIRSRSGLGAGAPIVAAGDREGNSGVLYSRAQPSGQATWQTPSASKFDDAVYKLQDKHIDTKRVVEAIRASGKAIADDLNVYLQEELFHGRAAKRTQDFVQQEVQPLMEFMQRAGLTMEQVEEYLHARHAREANAVIAARNPAMPDGGSGMTNAEADAVLAATTGMRRIQLERAAKMVDAIIGGTRQRPATGTPTSRAVMGTVREGKSARDILGLIAGTSKSRFNRQVARLLLKTGIEPKVLLEGGALGGKDGFTFLAKYSRANNAISLTEGAQGQAEQIILHEMVHAATLAALDRKGLHSLQMRRLFEHVKKRGGAAGQYGMKNVGEFVAEAFTNPDFQRALKGMDAPAGGTIRNAWDGFVRILRSILGLPQSEHSALSRALELGVAVMREDMALRHRGVVARGRGAQQLKDTERACGGRAAYDRAKAAGKTKLTYGQWVQVRTPNFKAWFGDWHALAAQQRLDAMEPVKVRVPDEWRGLPADQLRERVEASLLELMESGTPLRHAEIGGGQVVASFTVCHQLDGQCGLLPIWV